MSTVSAWVKDSGMFAGIDVRIRLTRSPSGWPSQLPANPESFNGGALQCFAGENAAQAVGGGVTLTYPGTTQLPAANCVSRTGRNGTITIDVPLSNVNEPGAIDNRLHEVTASTMTLQQRANTVPPVAGIGGSPFNLIDVAQGYTFDPAH